jgi:hypothetical protein
LHLSLPNQKSLFLGLQHPPKAGKVRNALFLPCINRLFLFQITKTGVDSVADYDAWFSSKIIELVNAALIGDVSQIMSAYNEVERGISYSNSTPGSITDLLVRMALGLVGPIKVTYRLEKKQERAGAADMNELKNALEQRKKDKVVSKMSGSLTTLKDYEEK